MSDTYTGTTPVASAGNTSSPRWKDAPLIADALTLDQQKALALAAARQRMSESDSRWKDAPLVGEHPVTLQIEGIGNVQVGNEFLKLSPEDQHKTVDEIAQSMASQPSTHQGLKPWENYAQPQMDGPWTKYQSAPTSGVTIAPKGGASREATPSEATYPNATGISPTQDFLRSVPTGLADAAIGIQGLPNFVDTKIVLPAAGWAVEKLGFGPGHTVADRLGLADTSQQQTPTGSIFPSSDQIKGAVENVTGPLHQPESAAGDLGHTLGTFLPALADPELLAARGALPIAANVGQKALTRVALPTATTEAAGQATKGTPYETAARIVGGLAGGGLGAMAEGAAARAASRVAIPTTQNLFDEAKANYATAKASGVVAKPGSFTQAVQNVTDAASNATMRPYLHPKAAAALSEVQSLAKAGVPQSLDQLDQTRRVIRGAAQSADKDERRVAYSMLESFDNYLNNLKPSDVLGGNTSKGVTALNQARKLWATASRSDITNNIVERAKNAVGANFTQAGYETALRQKFRALADNPNLMRRFPPQEQSAIRAIVRGAPIQNVIRGLGRFAVRGPVSAGVGLGVTALAGPAGGAAMWLAGEAAKRASTAMTMRNVSRLDELIRRSAAARPVAVPTSPAVLARLLTGNAATLPARTSNQ